MYENKGNQSTRLFIKITRETLPRVSDKYPFIYLERGRLEVDDSSIKWIDSEKNCVRLPLATILCILLGPGTTVTHEAVKTAAAANCNICWVGEDSLLFYAAGFTPTSNTRNLQRQAFLASNPKTSLAVARALYKRRFPDVDMRNKDLNMLMGMEGLRVREFYAQKSIQYGVPWRGRSYVPGKFDESDLVNKLLTSTNSFLYGILSSIIHSLGYSPHIGFIHSGSPLPLVYDLADLYKGDICIDLSFSLCAKLKGVYNRQTVTEAFRQRVSERNLLKTAVDDIDAFLGEESARSYR